MKTRLGTLAVVSWALLQPVLSAAQPFETTTDELTVRLVAERTAVVPGSDLNVGLHFLLQPGWHIYWINPGAAGLPTAVKWALPPGMTAQGIQWPRPLKIREPGVALYGYTGETLLPIPLHASPQLQAGKPITLGGEVSWTVCREICIPGKANLSLQLPVSSSAEIDLVQAPRFAAAVKSMPSMAPASWSAASHVDGDAFVLDVTTGRAESSGEFYPFDPDAIDDAADQAFTQRPAGLSLRLTQSQFMTKVPAVLRGLLVTRDGAYVLGAPLAGSGTDWISTPAESSASVSPSIAQGKAQWSEGLTSGLWFAFLGGLILNLMPCVLPVLSLKVISLAAARHQEAAQTRERGMLYLLGILVSFWLLAALLTSLRLAGRQIGWGFQMQSPVVVSCLAALMFLIGLNLLGVFEIGGAWAGAGSSLAGRGGRTGSFFTGVLATIVATPCTAPFMGVAIGFALTQPAWSIFLTFTALALGLAAPYVLLTLQPRWARVFPKPGLWMVRFRQALAFPMFGTVVWLVWVFAQQRGVNAAALLLTGLLMVSLTVWVLTAFEPSIVRNAMATVAGVLGAALPLAFAVQTDTNLRGGAPNVSVGSTRDAKAVDALVWEAFRSGRLRQYRSEGRPVLVDFTAAWCVTCLINERTVLRSADIRKSLTEQHVILLKADWTSYDPTITGALKEFGRAGVPFYVLYGRSETPVVATESLSSASLLAALETLRNEQPTLASASLKQVDEPFDH